MRTIFFINFLLFIFYQIFITNKILPMLAINQPLKLNSNFSLLRILIFLTFCFGWVFNLFNNFRVICHCKLFKCFNWVYDSFLEERSSGVLVIGYRLIENSKLFLWFFKFIVHLLDRWNIKFFMRSYAFRQLFCRCVES